ncbi:uncharacterized protein PV09_06653 [Verruconis gallopava]|uniref:Phytocyanin domain-containing protein n=1 Tax=Verruconis gallopava TaxID=253628 RepID=A0A0D1YLT6_9PEZI|nr:uncharacterized protein PV09_06653 [Verruconis gallopava]KIW01797.1 hypothetical protein PV09_06653 [Verruconis gallopava]
MHFSKSAVVAFASTALAANHNILVGLNGGLTFTPQTVNAAVGDTVTWTFLTQNHTVTSGTPNTGCAPDGTFNSGFIPVSSAAANAGNAAGANAAKTKGNFIVRGMNNIFDSRSALEVRQNTLPNFVYKVTSTQPQVFYCAQAQHCQVNMVGVINPASSGPNSLAAYSQLCAKAQTNQLPNTAAGTGGTLNAAAKAVVGKKASTTAAGTAATATTAANGATKAGKGGAANGAAGAANGATKAGKAGAATAASAAAGAAGKGNKGN